MKSIGKFLKGGWVPAEVKKELGRGKALTYRLKITLLGSEPPIWRRVLVSGGVTLGDLHPILQRAMGWTSSHLHMFHVGRAQYSEPKPEWDHEIKDQWEVRLCDVAPEVRSKFLYEYDMGDGWMHEVKVEKIAQANERYKGRPVCLDGARACPPEDCGGIGGYADFLAAIRDPKHEEHDNLLEWIGGSFEPEAFDLGAINKALGRLK